jgi:hypothetical protein
MHGVTRGWWFAALLALSGCCDVDGALRSLAGPGAIDCGYAGSRPGSGEPTRDDVISCAEAAQADGVPFYAGYTGHGIDSEVRVYHAMDASGQGWLVEYEAPLSGPGQPRVRGWACTGPFRRITVLGPSPTGFIDVLSCSTRTTEPNRAICGG